MSKEIKIESMGYGTFGVGRSEGKVYFVHGSAPGDTVTIKFEEDKKSYVEAQVDEVLEAGSSRVEAPCEYYAKCGGCSWQHLNYTAQTKWKERNLLETLKRVGKADITRVDQVHLSPKEMGYRQRAQYKVFGSKFGFFEKNSHSVVDIKECPLVDNKINEVFREVKSFMGALKTPMYEFELSKSLDGKVVMAAIIEEDFEYDWLQLLDNIEALQGIEVRVKALDAHGYGRRILIAGNNIIRYDVDDKKLTQTPIGFMQINLEQNGKLIERLKDAVRSLDGDHLVELFSGNGNLTIPLAGSFKKVTTVELIKESIMTAKNNARINDVENIKFLRGVAEDLKDLEVDGKAVLLIDPPRSGAKQALKEVVKSGIDFQSIIYVSCAPPTLARDVNYLTQNGYKLEKVEMFDFFPQTWHVETMAVLKKI